MLFGEEPRRPERSGITRAVSPKKIAERKKANVPSSGHRGEEKTRRTVSAVRRRDRSPMEVADDGLEDRLRRFRVADHLPKEPHL
jgi:hypothetical protein